MIDGFDVVEARARSPDARMNRKVIPAEAEKRGP